MNPWMDNKYKVLIQMNQLHKRNYERKANTNIVLKASYWKIENKKKGTLDKLLTTQTSWRFPGLSTPWLLNLASRTTISATLSYKKI